ncbi:extensin-like domain-containing protein [Pseudodonghicola flavimaris]|uniref:Extensin family protein n=1 Tax=Pseudodonghicola flavimaris TaxID=3050036 RepID=A0ABT7EYK6_9RHOB|nr:extensin family protein [Pseudodonghicola flavimaris]MDK3017418.1 extensin family protein [Pseudodonghicola flavimaris]
MIAARGAALGVLLLLAWSAAAGAPEHSPRPPMRAGAVPAAPAPSSAPMPSAAPASDRIRPAVRPVSDQSLQAAARPAGLPFLGPERSPAPWSRPEGLSQKAMAKKRALRAGAICGDIGIQGEPVGRVPGRIAGCGIEDAVRVRSVAGVRLSQPAVVTCDVARSLKTWVERGVKPAFRRRGPVVELKVAAHYVCRTRNNQRGAKISEHGRGRAIDISGFTMMDGEVVTVLKGWGQGTTLRPLAQSLKAACGPFGTVLGPNSDGYHKDHFHMDVARYRSGPYCR